MKKANLFWVVIIFLSVSLIWSLVWGFNSSQKLKVGKVCADADIVRTNQLLEAEDFSAEGFKVWTDEISGRTKAREDANCVMISLTNAQINDDQMQLKSDYEQLKKLSGEGQNPSLQFNQSFTLQQIEGLTQAEPGSQPGGKG